MAGHAEVVVVLEFVISLDVDIAETVVFVYPKVVVIAVVFTYTGNVVCIVLVSELDPTETVVRMFDKSE